MQDGGEHNVTARFPWSFASTIGQWVLAFLIANIGMAVLQVGLMLGVGALTQSMSLSLGTKQILMSGILLVSWVGGFGGAALFLSSQFRKRGLSMGDEMAINLKAQAGSLGRAFGQAGLGLFAVFGLNILISLLPLPAPESPAGDIAVQFSGLSFLIFALSGIIAAPIFEEILFRGYLLNALRIGFRGGFWVKLFGGSGKFADYAAIAISAAIFAGAHGTLTGFPQLFAAGVVFAALYRKTGSLIPSMLLHFLMNSLAFIALYMQTLGH
jgi:membrane protease YdiL (CAAX protease family)